MLEGQIFSSNKYGDFVVTGYKNCYEVEIKFINTGYTTSVEAGSVRRGTVKDYNYPSVFGVGFIGNGIHRSSVKKKKTKAYARWRHVLSRCYYDKYQRYSRYGGRGVSVCKEWHNYQIFAEWFYNNYKEGFDIDKDLTIPNSKIYSPETCCFVPSEINCLIVVSGDNDNGLPIGVSKDPVKGYIAFVKKFSKSINLGVYDSIDEAFLAYKKEKEDIIKIIANKHFLLGNINEVVYDNLINWKIIPYPD